MTLLSKSQDGQSKCGPLKRLPEPPPPLTQPLEDLDPQTSTSLTTCPWILLRSWGPWNRLIGCHQMLGPGRGDTAQLPPKAAKVLCPGPGALLEGRGASPELGMVPCRLQHHPYPCLLIWVLVFKRDSSGVLATD